MESALVAAVVVAGIAIGGPLALLAFVCAALCFLLVFFFWVYEVKKKPEFTRAKENPLLAPLPEHWWESEAVFNPGAVVHDGKVHLFYRALGRDGLSRIGYAVSIDGIHFERLPYPAYTAENTVEASSHYPYTSPARLSYDTVSYGSGGGWGGSEDPRVVILDDTLYLTFNMFNGWHSMRVAYTTLPVEKLSKARWEWRRYKYLSRPNERHKNWVLFPEKINGKFAVLHNLHAQDPGHVLIRYMDTLDPSQAPTQEESPDPHQAPEKTIAWHYHMRSAAAPPIKTAEGWLVFYHAADKKDRNIGYKLGALLLDLKDPSKILFRSARPVLEPREWYENEWKQGVIIASGAVVFGDDLIVYYGGGDKHVAAAKANLRDFLRKLTHNEHAVLEPVNK